MGKEKKTSLKDKAIELNSYWNTISESGHYVKLSDAEEEIERLNELNKKQNDPYNIYIELYRYREDVNEKDEEIQTLVELLRRAEKEINPFYLQGLETKKEITQTLKKYET